jgi:sulfatase maturation enzyme AslB (radical SAM superfamily)
MCNSNEFYLPKEQCKLKCNYCILRKTLDHKNSTKRFRIKQNLDTEKKFYENHSQALNGKKVHITSYSLKLVDHLKFAKNRRA